MRQKNRQLANTRELKERHSTVNKTVMIIPKDIPVEKRRMSQGRKLIRQMRFAELPLVLLLFAFLFLFSADLHAKEPEFYTLQTGSYSEISIALEQFNSLIEGLNGQEIDDLRLERIGKFYAVRLGRFQDRVHADKYLQANRAQLASSIILQSPIREKNVIRRYTNAQEEALQGTDPGQPLPPEEPREAKEEPLLLTEEPDNERADTVKTGEALLPVTPEYERKPVTTETEAGEAKAENKKDEAVKEETPGQTAPGVERSVLADIKGRFYISDYYSVDSGDRDFHMLTSRLKLYKTDNERAGYYFKIDGRARKKIADGDIHQDIPEYKFYELWMGYRFPGEKVDIVAGRQFINELYNTSVDGLNVRYSFIPGTGIGVFGGLAPDKYDYSFNSDFQSFGAYGYVKRDKVNVSLGYENLRYNGETDREYASLKFYSDLNKQLRFNLISSASINQLNNEFDIENINTNLLYQYSKNIRFNVFYNYYRAIRYFESSKQFFDRIDLAEDYFLDTNSQSRTGLRLDYRIIKGMKVYASGSYQKREIDNEDALRLTGGFRKYDLFGFDISGRYTYIDNFTSKSNEFNGELSRHFLDAVDVSLYASQEEEELDIENGFTRGMLTYGASFYWSINKHYYLSMFAERYDEDDYYNTSLFTQGGYRF